MTNSPNPMDKKMTALDGLAGPAVWNYSGVSMQQKQTAWQAAHAAAKNIKNLKNQAAKRRQIALWCQMVKQALKGGSA